MSWPPGGRALMPKGDTNEAGTTGRQCLNVGDHKAATHERW